jgi:hypothetical protein
MFRKPFETLGLSWQLFTFQGRLILKTMGGSIHDPTVVALKDYATYALFSS